MANHLCSMGINRLKLPTRALAVSLLDQWQDDEFGQPGACLLIISTRRIIRSCANGSNFLLCSR